MSTSAEQPVVCLPESSGAICKLCNGSGTNPSTDEQCERCSGSGYEPRSD